MAKGTAGGGGAATGAGQETKVPDKAASGNGGGDGAAAAAAGEQLVIRAPVHCDGCGRKLRRSLQRLEGVGEVTVDSRTDTVVVRGRRAVENAAEVVQVVERKTREKAVLVSPSPEKMLLPRSAPKVGGETNTKDDANTKDIGNELPEVDMKMVTVLKINLHCDACSEEIKRRILKITGVEEAMPHLKSSQMVVKGKVEPATLVGFIHKCTGRRAAIIRAEPLDDLLPQPPNPPAPPPPVVVAPPSESKKDEPPDQNPPGKEEEEEEEEPNEENRGGGGEEDNVDDNPKTQTPASDGHGGAAEEHGTHAREALGHDNDAGDGLVLENHTKAVDRLFAVPTPAGVVTVAPEMALGSRSYCYPVYPCAQYYYPYYQHNLYPQQYPASACSPVAMYGYPANYPPEAFSEENPNACTIV